MKTTNYLFLTMLIGVFSIACTKDDPPPIEIEPGVIKVSVDELIFERQEASQTITVITDVEWTPKKDSEWVQVKRDGNDLIVSVIENDSEALREGTITLTGDDAEPVVIKVIQKYDIFSLSQSDITFRWKSAQDEVVEVLYPNDKWELGEVSEKWLTAVKQNDGTILLSAADNDTNEPRQVELTLSEGDETATITVRQRATSDVEMLKEYSNGIMTSTVSANGRYVIGHNTPKNAWIWDLETGDFKLLGANIGCYGVTDDGVIVGGVDSRPQYYKDGSWHPFDLSALGLAEIPSSLISAATGVTPDGSTVVGYVANAGSDYLYYTPVVWRNGYDKPFEFLENPVMDIIDESPALGGRAEKVSNDGKVIIGCQYTRYGGSQSIAAMWTPQITMIAPELHYIVERRGKKTIYGFPTVGGVSRDGKWAQGCYQGLVMDEETGAIKHEEYIPFIYDIENRSYTLREFAKIEDDLSDVQAFHYIDGFLTSDLHHIYQSPGGAAEMSPMSWILNDTETMTFVQWFKREHNVSLENPNMVITGASDDMKTWVGYEVEAFVTFSPFCIRIND